MTYNILNECAPVYLSDISEPNIASHPLCSQSAGLLSVKQETGWWLFLSHAHVLWNNPPVEIRQADSLGLFKSKLKTYLCG